MNLSVKTGTLGTSMSWEFESITDPLDRSVYFLEKKLDRSAGTHIKRHAARPSSNTNQTARRRTNPPDHESFDRSKTMSAIRAFFGKLPRPSGRQVAVGAAALSAAAGGAWYYQQNADGKAEGTSQWIESFHDQNLLLLFFFSVY
jgi:hypothetical protein